MNWIARFPGRRNPSVDEWVEEGASLARRGRLKEAADVFGRALAQYPTSSVLWQNRGAMLGMMNQYAEALICYEQASRLAPGEIHHWRNRSALLGLLGRHEEALAAASEGLRLDPTDQNLRENRAAAQQALGRPDLSDFRAKAAIRTAAEPGKQGTASGLLDGVMRDGNVSDVASLVLSLLTHDVPNMAALYELAREPHRHMPSFDALMDMIEDGELVVAPRRSARADQSQPTPNEPSGFSSGAGVTALKPDGKPPTVAGARDDTPSAPESASDDDDETEWITFACPPISAPIRSRRR